MAESDARERILLASRQEIARSGVRGLRVQRVAKRAGVSLGLVYYHFEDRAGLLNATIDAVNVAVQERGPSATATDSGTSSVIDLLVAEFEEDSSVRDDSVVWNEIRAIAVFETELQAALGRSTREWEQRLHVPLSKAGVRAEDLTETATLLTALVEGLSSRWLSGQIDTAAAKTLIRAGAEAILRVARAERT